MLSALVDKVGEVRGAEGVAAAAAFLLFANGISLVIFLKAYPKNRTSHK